jgi:hypothetical protein
LIYSPEPCTLYDIGVAYSQENGGIWEKEGCMCEFNNLESKFVLLAEFGIQYNCWGFRIIEDSHGVIVSEKDAYMFKIFIKSYFLLRFAYSKFFRHGLYGSYGSYGLVYM